MKKFTLLILVLCMSAMAVAQQKRAIISPDLQNKAVIQPVPVNDPVLPAQSINTTTQSKAVLDDIIGASRYDMQSNASMMRRLWLFPDGTISATWTFGMADPAYADRGTGYNYFDGTAWAEPPTVRLETKRTGTPNISAWNGNGEIVTSHQATVNSPLVLNTRPVKGTGAWTQMLINAPTGAPGILWNRMITNGPNHNYVHFIALTFPTGNGGTVYQGLDGALLYYRSLDGGATWDINGEILPGMTSAEYNGIEADGYAWGTPHGDTIYFAVSGNWTDTYIMASYDNGTTWNKIQVFPNPYHKVPITQVIAPFYCGDGQTAVELDQNGVFHIAFGRMRVNGNGAAHYYFPGTDGQIYWNSTMAPLDTNRVKDFDSLEAHGQLLGYVAANGNPNDTIIDFPYYGGSLSSFPQIVIDQYNNIYFLWSSLTVGNPSPDPYNYRHIWARAKFHDRPHWTEMQDLNTEVIYLFQEYVYPGVAPELKNNNILLITQTSSQPGSNIKDTTIPVHDVNIEYREIPVSTFWPVGIVPKPVTARSPVSQNYPNPVKDKTYFNINLEVAAVVSIEVFNIMGQRVMSIDKGTVHSGIAMMTLDGHLLDAGVYFYTVKINGESYTHKMIVE